MKLIRKIALLLLLILTVFTSCKNAVIEDKIPVSYSSKAFEKKDVIVKINDVSFGTFSMEIISNGKATALNSAEIMFPVNAEIKAVNVKNGDWVIAGQLLAKLEDADLKSNMSRNLEALSKALVELDDRLIDYGYRLKDSAKVPVEILRMARIKSGYNGVLYDYADAKNRLVKTNITAPFSGKIANLEAKPYNASGIYGKFCTLIDDRSLKIEFNVLETEYKFINKGSLIEVSPFGQNSFVKGIVTEINPIIDNNGMIKIIGLVDNSNGYLLDGMSVRVIARSYIPKKIFIPKAAVLQRQDKEVVFTYEAGRAKWNYVETGLQNTKFIIINSGLANGQKVITSNNITLAHDVIVSVDKNQTLAEK